MIDRVLLEQRLASSVTGWFWGWFLVIAGVFAGVVFGLNAGLAERGAQSVFWALVAVSVVAAVAGAAWAVRAHSEWRSAKPLLRLEPAQSVALEWGDPRATFHSKGRVRFVAQGGCAYCGAAAPVSQRERRTIASQKRAQSGWVHFGLVGLAVASYQESQARKARRLPGSGGVVELGYALCEPCRSCRPRFAWAAWGLVAGVLVAGLNLVVALREGPTPAGVDPGAWRVLTIALPLLIGGAFPLSAMAARSFGAPVRITRADVELGIVLETPPHLVVQPEAPEIGAGPAVPPPRYC